MKIECCKIGGNISRESVAILVEIMAASLSEMWVERLFERIVES